jgi:hypothetical protein
MDLQWLTRNECAAALGISVKSLNDWERQEWFPKAAKRGKHPSIRWCPQLIAKARQEHSKPVKAKEQSSKNLLQERLQQQIRRERARADLDEARVAEQLSLLLPRVSNELVLSTLFGDLRVFFADVIAAVHQIPPDKETGQITAETVGEWLDKQFTPFQDKTASRLERMLIDMGSVVDLQHLAQGLRQPAEEAAGSD